VRERALVAGITFSAIAENLLQSLGADDPVRNAVWQWMRSRGHRENILDPEFTETGVGIEVDEDGRLYFTQLFLRPLGKDDGGGADSE
ncbi:MAG: CAP domain-containing protein, partial [Acidobacteriota bacterium]|nr:CAP domain-containing protein [Acidobacteriota bacterium]